MSTPVDEMSEPSHSLPQYNVHNLQPSQSNERSSDEDGTVVGETAETSEIEKEESYKPHLMDHAQGRARANSHLTVQTANDYEPGDPLRNLHSPSQTREQAHRLDDDLALLKIERQVSHAQENLGLDSERSNSNLDRSRSRRDDTVDEFDIATNPIHEKTQIYKPPAHPVGATSRFIKKLHGSNVLVRYITYITPVVLILLIPLLLGALLFKRATVGGVRLVWFMIWLEIVWLTLWAGRILAKALPWPIGLVSSLFTNNGKKWRDMGKQLELPATLFFWLLAVEVSFLPTMKHHQLSGSTGTQSWMGTMNKVVVSLFVGATLNFIEKIIIQLIAISFHLRTYQDRIEINKFQIGSLTKLYIYSREKIQMEDSEFEQRSGPGSGARTPGQYLQDAQKTTLDAVNKFGDVAGKIAGDFTGKKVTGSRHPHQVILSLLHTAPGSQVLARRLYRTFAREETETVYSDDLRHAFENDDEAEAAFSMFDKDMNGDISMEELEAVCVEIGRERKSITASLKDLDSVVGKLDQVFMFAVLVIVILVLISLISTSAAGVLTSAGSTVLALSWLFSATAQEFLQSVIFVFVKHPFDVGDRVSVYGNTGALGRGDDYFVKEISLLYTEFKKMEGHIVQAPNSYLNTIFILNQRRSGGLAEAVSITIKFGTTLEQIEGLRNRLLDFVKQEKREYQGNILTELRDVVEAHSLNLNVVFFYKSNWQNEGLRLARRNKFICALMVTMQELNIEGPRMRYPGQKESFPVYLQNVPHVATPGVGRNGNPENPGGWQEEDQQKDPPFVTPLPPGNQETPAMTRQFSRQQSNRAPSTVRRRGESLSQMNRRVDFSLGAQNSAAMNAAGDVFDERRPPIQIIEASNSRERSSQEERARTSRDFPRLSEDIGRSTSRASHLGPGNLARRSTDNESRISRNRLGSIGFGSVHRNRFFGRGHGGPADEQFLMENGMADIPEVGESPATAGQQRLDPRSGLVSPAAWRTRTDESNVHPPPPPPAPTPAPATAQTVVQDHAPQVPPVDTTTATSPLGELPHGYRSPVRAATDGFEMRSLHRD